MQKELKPYDVARSDKIGSAGLITREIVKQIINSELVIADVSDQNPNRFLKVLQTDQ